MTPLEVLLTDIEAELAAAGRESRRQYERHCARQYRRSLRWLSDLVPLSLAQAACVSEDPALTWRILRHLCHHIRLNTRSPLGSNLRLMRCRTMARGELAILERQRQRRANDAAQRLLDHQQAMTRGLGL